MYFEKIVQHGFKLLRNTKPYIVMAGMNGMDISGYTERVEELTPNDNHPYGIIRAEFVRMGAEYAESMQERGHVPTFEESLAELNYQYGKVRPLIEEIRKDVDAHKEMIHDLLSIYHENPNSLVVFDDEMFADPGASNHKIQIVDGSSKGFAEDRNTLSPLELAILHDDIASSPLNWESKTEGSDSPNNSSISFKGLNAICDIHQNWIQERMHMQGIANWEYECSMRDLDYDQIHELSEFKKYLDSIPLDGHKQHHVSASEYIINKIKSIEFPDISCPKLLSDIKEFFSAKQPEFPTERVLPPNSIVLA